MISSFATLLATAIYVIALAPLALAAWRPAHSRKVSALYFVAVITAVTFHTGILNRQNLASYDMQDIDAAARMAGPASECAEILRLLDRAGAIIDRRDPDRLIVRQQTWDQLPGPVRDVVTNCVDRGRPEASRARPIEIVPQ